MKIWTNFGNKFKLQTIISESRIIIKTIETCNRFKLFNKGKGRRLGRGERKRENGGEVRRGKRGNGVELDRERGGRKENK